MENNKTRPVILDSSVPFVLVVPHADHVAPAAKSRSASTELVGMAAAALAGDSEGYERGSFHVVSSSALGDYDRRTSQALLAWRGQISPDDLDRITWTFQRSIPDTLLALKASDVAALEWSLGPVLFQCAAADERRSAQQQQKQQQRTQMMWMVSLGLVCYLVVLAAFYVFRLIGQ